VAEETYVFEMDREEERDRYLLGLKHVVARFVSKLILGDLRVY